ncbi:Phage small terminase subunit, partial [Haemophilus influenzae]
KTP